jgi:tetratricopeptide (TPR) repeat protein
VEVRLKPRPSVVPTFVGREDILESMRQTHFGERLTGSDLPAVTVLTGLGGSGKTQIALKFALDFEERCSLLYVHAIRILIRLRDPDAAVYFVNAESKDSLKTDYESIIRSQGGAHRSDSHEDALRWLATQQKGWCVILDNADNPDVDIFLDMPKGSHGNVVITTRNLTHSAISPNNSHVVQGLIMPDAIALLLEISKYEITSTNQLLAQQIVHEVEHLPLALAHAGGYIYLHRCLDSYLAMYQRSKAKFLAARPRSLPHDYQLSVATTIQMSLERLPAVAHDVMVIYSQLEATSIAQSIVTKAAERQFKNIYTDLAAEPLHPETIQHADTLMSIFCPSGEWLESDFNDIIEKCLQYSLLQSSTQQSNKFYSMHKLVQAYLQVNVSSVREHQPSQLIIRILGSAVTIGDEYEHLAFNHLLASHLRLVRTADVIEAEDHDNFGRVLMEHGDLQLSEMHLDRCVTLRRSYLEDGSPLLLSAMGNLACVYRDLGRYRQTAELEELILEKRSRLLGLDHPDTVITMSNLSVSYDCLGRYQEALELNEKVVEKQKRLLGLDDPLTACAMTNLATSYRRLGQYRQAVEIGEQVLERRKDRMGPDHIETLITMGNLSMSYHDLGKYQQALELQEYVLEKRKELLGPDHPDTVMAMANTATCYRGLERHQEAVELGEEVLDKRRRLLGPDHPNTIRAIGNIASYYKDMGQYQQAVELEKHVLEKRLELLGPDHSDTVLTMGNLAFSYYNLEQYHQAVELLEQVLEKQQGSLGPVHPETIRAMSDLSSSYCELGQYQQAVGLQEQVLARRRELLGDEHPHALMAIWNLLFTLGILGMMERRLEILTLALPLYERVRGKDHRQTVAIQKALQEELLGDSTG